MPSKIIIGTLNHEHRLLTAYFDICGELVPVMIDTGATISCLPGNGIIMRKCKPRLLPASLNVQLADDTTVHVDKKVLVPIKPKHSNKPPVGAQFYVQGTAECIFGYEALIGLNNLSLFDLEIKVKIYHDGRCIGEECPKTSGYQATIKVDERFENLQLDNDLLSIVRRYKKVFTDLDPNPIRGEPMRIITVHNRPIFAKQRHYNPEEIKQFTYTNFIRPENNRANNIRLRGDIKNNP